MASTSPPSGYSAQVSIQLRLGDQVLEVAELGPDFLVLMQPISHPPAEGVVVLTIDDSVSQWPVSLAEGISPSVRDVALATQFRIQK